MNAVDAIRFVSGTVGEVMADIVGVVSGLEVSSSKSSERGHSDPSGQVPSLHPFGVR